MNNSVDGMFAVKFESNIGAFGGGVVSIRDLKVAGGDSGYAYSGPMIRVGNEVAGTIHVKRHDPSQISIFGNIDEFTLQVRGVLSFEGGTLEGYVVERPELKLRVRLVRQQMPMVA